MSLLGQFVAVGRTSFTWVQYRENSCCSSQSGRIFRMTTLRSSILMSSRVFVFRMVHHSAAPSPTTSIPATVNIGQKPAIANRIAMARGVATIER